MFLREMENETKKHPGDTPSGRIAEVRTRWVLQNGLAMQSDWRVTQRMKFSADECRTVQSRRKSLS